MNLKASERVTHDHPDDDMRILHLGYTEAAIRAARAHPLSGRPFVTLCTDCGRKVA